MSNRLSILAEEDQDLPLQQSAGIVMYIFLPVYALASDLNQVWDPNSSG